MKIKHKLLISLLSIFTVLLLVVLSIYQASLKVEFYRERSSFLSHQLASLISVRAQVRNQILEAYEVSFVEGMETHAQDIEHERELARHRFSELEAVMTSESEKANSISLRKSYDFLDQGLQDGARLSLQGQVEQAKSKILQARDERFIGGFLQQISALIEDQGMISKESSKDLNQSISNLKDISILSVLLAIALTIGITIYLSGSIGGRLTRLEEATQKIAKGEFDISLDESGHDEITSLAKSFNQMAMSLDEARVRLRQQQEIVTHSSKMSALGEMAGGVAHEINTPLAIIQLRTEQLLERSQKNSLASDDLNKGLKTIDQTVQRIGKIVNGLRSFARDGSQDPLISYSVAQIVEDTFSLCQERFRKHNVQIDFVFKEDVEIFCRPSEISQVLLNLLNNSFDAVQELQQQWVRVELCFDAQKVLLVVIDSGSGIAKEVQDKMMQPFFTTKEIGKGTGLGLSISKGIIESHHGKIEIDNTQKNTTFVLQFPRASADHKSVTGL